VKGLGLEVDKWDVGAERLHAIVVDVFPVDLGVRSLVALDSHHGFPRFLPADRCDLSEGDKRCSGQLEVVKEPIKDPV
jgi:hypothetical protein